MAGRTRASEFVHRVSGKTDWAAGRPPWADSPSLPCRPALPDDATGGIPYNRAMNRAPRPPFIVSPSEVTEETGRYPGSDEDLSAGRPIGRAAGLQRIGLHLERVAPGTRTSWPHAEEKEEEFVFVVEGEVNAWIDGVLYPMKAGDLAAFPAGTGICHTFLNDSDRDALLLVGGERDKPDNRIFYPLHPHRREQMSPARWWDDVPLAEQGPHDGLPS